MSTLPNVNELSKAAEFFRVGNVPIAIDDLTCVRYDAPEPHAFDLSEVMEHGEEITREEFLALATKPVS
jgi:hypothetical protein